MTMPLEADFFAASLLTLLMPAAFVVAVAVYAAFLLRRSRQRTRE
jgi:hypothetical protein